MGKNILKFIEDLIWILYNNYICDNVYVDILKKKERFFFLEKIDIYWFIFYRVVVLMIKLLCLCYISYLMDFFLEKN